MFRLFDTIFVAKFRESGWNGVLCENQLFGDDTWWQWVYLFYLSKYYEFLDTYILIWKGRNPSFLQKFHHIGAVIGMWIIVATKSHTGYVFVIPNSFIHSIMYFYYALSVWKIRIPFKYILTRMQIIQFCVGVLLGFIEYYHWECLLFSDRASLLWNTFYIPILLLLFLAFYRKTYRSKKSKANWDYVMTPIWSIYAEMTPLYSLFAVFMYGVSIFIYFVYLYLYSILNNLFICPFVLSIVSFMERCPLNFVF